MNPIVFALRHPYTVMVAVAAVVVGSIFAMQRAKVDIFPNLNQPVLYVCQPYGGMSPQQMEGLLTNYLEFHFLYVNGIEHVESKNIQGMTLLKLAFHPGTDMAAATAEVVAAVNRSRFMMPPGTVPPFVTRHDVGSSSVGFLVLSSDKLAIKDIQDMATLKVRPMFASIDGISTPPAFGGNQRAIVVSVLPEALHRQGITLEQVTDAVSAGNAVAPSGNLRIGDRMLLVTTNAMAGANVKEELGKIAVKTGPNPVFLRDVATVDDSSDITAGYVLVNGRRSVYMLVTKRSNASTISVVNALEEALPKMREAAPGVDIEFAFDQSPIVTSAMWGVGSEGLIGALLTGLMVLVFLRDWRSVIVVVLNIPFALLAAVLGLWLTGQTINLMTLGGLALAVGILVDEATVEVENIHSQMSKTDSVARAVRRGNQETAVPRLLAMLCILAVFVPSFVMNGAARELFVPLSLAVGFSMIASYLLSSTFVPVLCIWLLKKSHAHADDDRGFIGVLKVMYTRLVKPIVALRWIIVPLYFAATILFLLMASTRIGTAIFPPADNGQFMLRMRAPTGTRIERTEELARQAVRIIEDEAGPAGVNMTVGYVGMFPTNYPIQAVHQWTSGPDEMLMKVSLSPTSGKSLDEFKTRLRTVLKDKLSNWLAMQWTADGLSPEVIAKRVATLSFSFEPGDLISEVMSFGSPTPIEVQISGNKMADTAPFANKVLERFKAIQSLRDVQLAQAQEYPTAEISFDREKAATMGLNAKGMSNSLIPATASSRYMNPIYWRDPASGQAYIVQVQVPPPTMNSLGEVGLIPVRGFANGHTAEAGSSVYPVSSGINGGASAGGVLLRDVVSGIRETTTPGRIDRYNMRRMLSVTANVATEDLGLVGREVRAALAELGKPPAGVNVDVRGQLVTLDQVQTNLSNGLLIAILVIALLLTAYFQSLRLMLAALSALPATVCGSAFVLLITGTTLNLQSFMGAIMALGVSTANAILLVTFAERMRTAANPAKDAAIEGSRSRLRAILMTSFAMVAGMIPMALGLGEGGGQAAPLGRAVVGGLIASTFATLLIVPAVYAMVMGRSDTASVSLDPDDAESPLFDPV
ncbi:efflux RND transporter permease subunit [soil metagenome]